VPPELRKELEQTAMQVRQLDEQVTLVVVEGDESVPSLLKLALAAGARVLSVTPHRETLEDLFVRKAVSEQN
jgi:ABC-2 type transport system ATP-binding protein